MNIKKPRFRFVVVALILGVCSFAPLATSSRVTVITETAQSITDLAWMSGGWRTAPGGRAQIEEHWTAPAGGSMLGMSRTVAGDRTVEFEYLRLEQRSGDIYYIAHPKARYPGTEFKLTRLAGQEAVFENPAHDFPKRIIYRKGTDGSLTATIDGGEGTKSMKFAYFPMTK